MKTKYFSLILILITLISNGCGGGTSGSGLKTYEGKIESSDGAAMDNVTVTIETTGDSSVSDSEGEFVIKSDAYGEEVPFLFESKSFQNRFVLKDVPHSSSRISMEVTIDPKTNVMEVNNVQLKARFAGLCDHYFENREVIRQSVQVPAGTICSLNVEVLGDGIRLENVPVDLQYAGCADGSEFKTLKRVLTGTAEHAGSAEINFEYIDSLTFCRYRVKVAMNVGNSSFAIYPIDTFTEQEYFRKHAE